MSSSLLSLVQVPHSAVADPGLFPSTVVSAQETHPVMQGAPGAPLPVPGATFFRESLFSPLCTEWRLNEVSLCANAATRHTLLGQKLEALRKKALAKGLKLLGEDEILEEVRLRRGEQP
ncbi:MAG: hypothetical protein WHT08_06610 [Bryobacteraceae bacterium]